MNDIVTLQSAAAEYRRLAGECGEPGERAVYLELALVLEILLRALEVPAEPS